MPNNGTGIASSKGSLRADLDMIASEFISEEAKGALVAPVRTVTSDHGEFMRLAESQLLNLQKRPYPFLKGMDKQAPSRDASLRWKRDTYDTRRFADFHLVVTDREQEQFDSDGIDWEAQYARTYGIQSGILHGLAVGEVVGDNANWSGTETIDDIGSSSVVDVARALCDAQEFGLSNGVRYSHALISTKTLKDLMQQVRIADTQFIASAEGGVAVQGYNQRGRVESFFATAGLSPLTLIVDDCYLVDEDGDSRVATARENAIILFRPDSGGMEGGWLTTFARSPARALGEIITYPHHNPEGVGIYMEMAFGVKLHDPLYARGISWDPAAS